MSFDDKRAKIKTKMVFPWIGFIIIVLIVFFISINENQTLDKKLISIVLMAFIFLVFTLN